MQCVSEVTTFRDFVRSSERIGIRQYAMILESYFDDSSDDKRENYRAYGGLIGSAEQWDAQLLGWNNATYGLEEPVRSTDCEGGHGQFKGVDKAERDARMASMVDVIKTTKLGGFASIVPVRIYRQVFPNSRPNDPSLLALRQAIMNMAYIANNFQMDVQMWFELGNENASITKAFESIMGYSSWTPAKRLRSLLFDTKRCVGLQAADLVAREAFKHIANRGIRRMRIPVIRLSDRLAFVLWNKETLEFLAKNGGPEDVGLLADWDNRPGAPKFGWHVINPALYTSGHDANSKDQTAQ